MQLIDMELSNFRLFKYRETITFKTEDGKPLTIVRAANRTGKTTLLTALQWCLWGQDAVEESRQALKDGDLIVSSDALNEATPGDIVTTEVALRFEHQGTEYIARRIRESKVGESESELIQSSNDVFMILKQDSTGTKPDPHPTVLRDHILPVHLRELFFFDGDRINTFMEPDHEKAVQNAVSDMLEFELFQEAQSDLRAIVKEYDKELLSQSTGEVAHLRNRLAELTESQEQGEFDLNEFEHEIEAEEAIHGELTQELAGMPGDAGQYQTEINSNVAKIKNLESGLASLSADLGKQLAQREYFTVTPLLNSAREQLQAMKSAGEIPKRIGEALIKERLELGMCICGRPIIVGEDAHTHLLGQLAEQIERSELEEVATDALYYLNALARKSDSESLTQLDGRLVERANIEATKIELERHSKELEVKIKGIPVEAIENKRLAVAEVRKRITDLVGKKVEQQNRNFHIADEKTNASKLLNSAIKAEERNSELFKRKELADAALIALTLTYQSVRDIERGKISELTQNNFFTMNIRKDEFTKVEVSPSFRLQVVASQGHMANSVLSGAQRRALSLSFLLALIQVSERDFPVVVDTPLGMTSGPMREKITEVIIEQSKQIVLLLTRAEISGVETILRDHAAVQQTLTCSLDYPTEVVNPPLKEGSYTQVCNCTIDSHCSICERKELQDSNLVPLQTTGS
jgi:DNA sulfur modification protein DndD